MKSVTVFAPATVANVAVGFDILGFALDCVGDELTVRRGKTTAILGELPPGIPREPEGNTATAGLVQMTRDLGLDFGFEVFIKKGIALGSGMGGSAASAVAGVVGANALLDRPLSKSELLKFALTGEAVASGAIHPDNVAPCLFGGMVIAVSLDPLEIISLPVPNELFCVLLHPEVRVDTRDARGVLKKEIALHDHVRQSSKLSGFLAGCYRSDVDLMGRSTQDFLIEPQRAKLIPGFSAVKAAAMKIGALGCSISGSGPSVFAFVKSKAIGAQVKRAMTDEFKKAGVESQGWVSKISHAGAVVVK